MSNGKVKIYKNPDRDKPVNVKPYVPQWQVLNKEPTELKSAVVPNNTPMGNEGEDNPRLRKFSMRQPYAVTIPSPMGMGKGPIPNVGNNIEHTWSSVDGEIIDDLTEELDPNQEMIDNNDFVTEAAFGFKAEALPSTQKFSVPQITKSSNSDIITHLIDLEENSYILFIKDVAICSGPLSDVEKQASQMVFGEHEICDGNPVPPEDLIILKRVKIKMGLFLE